MASICPTVNEHVWTCPRTNGGGCLMFDAGDALRWVAFEMWIRSLVLVFMSIHSGGGKEFVVSFEKKCPQPKI